MARDDHSLYQGLGGILSQVWPEFPDVWFTWKGVPEGVGTHHPRSSIWFFYEVQEDWNQEANYGEDLLDMIAPNCEEISR